PLHSFPTRRSSDLRPTILLLSHRDHDAAKRGRLDPRFAVPWNGLPSNLRCHTYKYRLLSRRDELVTPKVTRFPCQTSFFNGLTDGACGFRHRPSTPLPPRQVSICPAPSRASIARI